MRSKKYQYLWIFILVLFSASYLYLLFYFLNNNQKLPALNSTEKVTRIIDGDTIEIEGGIRIRLIGIDTPELKNKDKNIDCYALEAKNKTSELLIGKSVFLEKDVSETDKFGRLLRYVYLGSELINNTLIKEGYAKVATYPPDIKYSSVFVQSQREAIKNSSGLWSKCKI